MKKIIAGVGMLIAGTILYGAAAITAGVAVAATTEPGWDTEMGMYWQSVVTCGMDAPIAFGIVLSIVGLCFLLWGVFSANKKKDKPADE